MIDTLDVGLSFRSLFWARGSSMFAPDTVVRRVTDSVAFEWGCAWISGPTGPWRSDECCAVRQHEDMAELARQDLDHDLGLTRLTREPFQVSRW